MNRPSADLLSATEVAALLGISVKSLYRYRATGGFPDPIRVGPRLIRWPSRVVNEWLVREGVTCL
jgi:predicted DNA-binding transcriptional regulator AlpA